MTTHGQNHGSAVGVSVLDSFQHGGYVPAMHDPGFTVVAEDELADVLRAALRQGGGTISRETDLFMASLVAEHLADRIAAAGLRIVRPRPPSQWLLP